MNRVLLLFLLCVCCSRCSRCSRCVLQLQLRYLLPTNILLRCLMCTQDDTYTTGARCCVLLQWL